MNKFFNQVLRELKTSFPIVIDNEIYLQIPCDDASSVSGAKVGSIRAEVIPVPQTNLFLALINESCDPQHPIQVFLSILLTYLSFIHLSLRKNHVLMFDNVFHENVIICPLKFLF